MRQLGELPQPAIVVQVLDRSFDALLMNLGLVRRVYTDQLPLTGLHYHKQAGSASLVMDWAAEGGKPPCTQRVVLLERVDVVLRPLDQTSLRFHTTLVRPT